MLLNFSPEYVVSNKKCFFKCLLHPELFYLSPGHRCVFCHLCIVNNGNYVNKLLAKIQFNTKLYIKPSVILFFTQENLFKFLMAIFVYIYCHQKSHDLKVFNFEDQQ